MVSIDSITVFWLACVQQPPKTMNNTTPHDQALVAAAGNGDLAAVQAALDQGANPNATHNYETALHSAAMHGHLAVVQHLIEKGADIELKDGADMSALMAAVLHGQVGVANYLLSQKAHISRDLMSSLALKVSILHENAGNGLVTQEGADAWQAVLDKLGQLYHKQEEAKA